MTYIADPKEFAHLKNIIEPFTSWPSLCKNRNKADIRYFDWVEFKVKGFSNYINALAKLGGDKKFYFYDLESAPIQEFYTLFKKYPIHELKTGISQEAYSSALNEEPGKVPGYTYAVLTTGRYAVFPESMNWYIYGEYDIELAILISKVGLPADDLFPHAFISEKEAERLMALKK